MTLVFASKQPDPQTHALVLGVGEYAKLSQLQEADLRALKPLPEAPLSALAFLEWLLKVYRPPTGQLGTVECLLSPTPAPGGAGIATPGMANVITAFNAWAGRCTAHPDNVAVFYFCGHGMMKSTSTLLTDDFGANPLDPFGDAIDFDGMKTGMLCCQASTQLFFADACRVIPRTALQMVDALSARPLWSGRASGFRTPKALSVQATLPGREAWAATGQVTLFTQALLESLNGVGSERLQGSERTPGNQCLSNARWVTTTTRLGEGIADGLVRLVRLPGTPEQYCDPHPSGAKAIFHVLPGDPQIPVRIGCRPAETLRYALFEVTRRGNPVIICSRAQAKDAPWDFTVPPDFYTARATFQQPGLRIKQELEVWAIPPSFTDDLEVVS